LVGQAAKRTKMKQGGRDLDRLAGVEIAIRPARIEDLARLSGDQL